MILEGTFQREHQREGWTMWKMIWKQWTWRIGEEWWRAKKHEENLERRKKIHNTRCKTNHIVLLIYTQTPIRCFFFHSNTSNYLYLIIKNYTKLKSHFCLPWGNKFAKKKLWFRKFDWFPGQRSQFSLNNKFPAYKVILKPIWALVWRF